MLDNHDIRKLIAEGSHLKHLEESLVPFGELITGLESENIVEDNTPAHLRNGAVWDNPINYR